MDIIQQLLYMLPYHTKLVYLIPQSKFDLLGFLQMRKFDQIYHNQTISA